MLWLNVKFKEAPKFCPLYSWPHSLLWSQTAYLSQFKSLWQNTLDWIAYKQQKFMSQNSGG